MSDPNGLIQWNGHYHVFYQHRKFVQDGRLLACWAHAVSEDLVRWEHLPVALLPTLGGPDADGCASGCAVDNQGVPTFIYTGVHPEVTCIATSDDTLVRWHKRTENPVIPGPPGELDVVGFRDHSAWQEEQTWYQIIGSGIHGRGPALPLYRSFDLIGWEYLGLLFAGEVEQSGPMWECPDFFSVADQAVLIVSECPARGVIKELGAHSHRMMDFVGDYRGFRTVYFVGDYRDFRFHSRLQGRLDFGTSFYAPQSMEEVGGRRLMWGWLREERSPKAQQEAGWSGAMSLPRVLTVGADGHLNSEPLPELRSLRRSHQSRADLDLQPGVVRDLGVHGAQVEIVVEFDPVAVGKVGLAVRASPGGEEETLISYNFADDQLEIDCRRSSLDLSTNRPLVGGPLRLPRGEPLQLHVFLDASVIEIFANGRAAAARVYPRLSDSLSIRAFNCPPSAYESLAAAPSQYLRRVDVWELDSIWEGTERIPPDG